MAASTTSTKLWTSEAQDLKRLLKEYYRALAAEEAYNRFFGPTAQVGGSGSYEDWQDEIAEATKAPEYVPGDDGNATQLSHITGKGEAKAAIDDSNFAKNRNEFRKVGILTGIDPEAFPGFEVRTSPSSVWENVTREGEEASEHFRRDDLIYNTGVNLPTISKIPRLEFKQDDPVFLGQESGNRAASDWSKPGDGGRYALFFASPAMIQSLVAQSYDGSTQQYVSGPYMELATKMLNSGQSLVAAQSSFNSNSRNEDAWTQSINFYTAAIAKLPAPEKPPTCLDYIVTNKVLYADIFHNKGTNFDYGDPAPTVASYITSVMGSLSSFGTPIEAIMILENFGTDGNLRSGAEWDKLVLDERNAILNFFNVKPGGQTATALPDAPEFDNISQILADKEVGEDFKAKLVAARRNLSPRDMQCYLLENIRSIVGQRKGNAAASTRVASTGKYAPNYKNIKRISTGGQPALLTNFLRYGKNTGNIDRLLDLCPDVYGILQPYIRLFRVDYDDEGNVAMINVPGSTTPVPAEAELIIPNFLEKSDVAAVMLDYRGRAAGAGLKSFSWSLDGTQPAEVDNNIRANLQVYFQSVNDFFRGARQAGAVDSTGFPEPNFLDLIVNSPAIRKNKNGSSIKIPPMVLHREYKGANFRIKALVGWARPDVGALHHALKHRGGNLEAAKDIADVIEDTQTTFFLQCTRHNLDFRQDGTVQIDIEYAAALAGILSGPKANILAPSTESIRESLESNSASIESDASGDNLTERQTTRKEELLEERNKIIQQDRLIKYKKLLRGLFSSPKSKVYQLPVDINDMLRDPWTSLSAEQRAARAKRKQAEAHSFLMTSPQQLNLTLLESTSDALAAGGETNGADAFTKAETARYAQIQARSTQFKFVPFMFLGDLIDNVIEQTTVNNNGKKLNFTTFLSDTDLVDPLVALQIKGLEGMSGTDLKDVGFVKKLQQSDPYAFRDAHGITLSVNIGDIPISVDAFQVWFKDNVIKKDLDKFYLLYFIKKLCADLIVKAFKSDCFGTDLRINQRFDAHPISLASSRRAPLRDPIGAQALGEKLQIKSSTPTHKTHNAVVILPTDSRPANLDGSYTKDKSVGIHHHHIGSACGLLKKISFSRMDQEYLREANIQKHGALGPEQLRELYSVTIEMVGNNLYENGMYIYISPTLLDANKEDLDYLGLHGYYMITSVASKLTSAGFTTTIQALHEGIDFKHNSTLTAEMYDVPPEPPLPNANPEDTPPPIDPAVDPVGAQHQEDERIQNELDAADEQYRVNLAELKTREGDFTGRQYRSEIQKLKFAWLKRKKEIEGPPS